MITPRVLLVPSSPTLLIDERRGDSTEMIQALLARAPELAADEPAALVVVTSRWSSVGLFHVDDSRRHASLIDLPGFGVEPRYDCAGEPALARAIVDEARRAGMRAAPARRGADTGISVPLHFVASTRRWPVVPVSISDSSAEAHRGWGAVLRRALTTWSGRAAFIVSGAITFSQHEFNLRRESAEDRDLDALAMQSFGDGDWTKLAERARKFPAKAHPEADWRHLQVLRGFLGEEFAGRVIAYEYSPGIGSVLVEFALVPAASPATGSAAAPSANPAP